MKKLLEVIAFVFSWLLFNFAVSVSLFAILFFANGMDWSATTATLKENRSGVGVALTLLFIFMFYITALIFSGESSKNENEEEA